MASKAKKKISDSSSKKDKKKDKKKNAKEPSITDVIAVELMEKAKKTIEPEVKNEKSRTPSPTPSPPPPPNFAESEHEQEPPTPPRIDKNITKSSNKTKDQDDEEFNIPTISEITTSSSNQNLHKKELMQLKDLQNRIYEKKRKLVDLSDGETMTANKEKSQQESVVERSTELQKKSVKSRLGVKPTENSKPSTIISLSAIRKTEMELYNSTSTFRKLIERQKEENEKRDDDRRSTRYRIDSNNSKPRREKRSRSRSNSRDRFRNRDRIRRRSRSRSPIRRSQERKSRPSIRQRIGNRPLTRSKTPENDGKSKIKMRPALSSAINTHGGKKLFVRAMADASRSTSTASTGARKRDNIVVQVRNTRQNDEEYVPESISGHSESEAEYHPSFKKEPQENVDDDGDVLIYNDGNVDLDDLDDNEVVKSPQFVVTFDKVSTHEYSQHTQSSNEKSPTPPPVIKRKSKSIKDRIGARHVADKINLSEISNKHADEKRSRKRRAQDEEEDEEMKEIDLKKTLTEEEEECESQRAYNKVKKTRVSPIKFDLTDDENDDGKSRSSSRDRHEKKTPVKHDIRDDHNGDDSAKRIRLETSRSFDHIPPLSSVAIAVPASSENIKPVKSKDRCKFYPSCSNVSCLFYHPSLPCKIFPNCKFGDSCAYVHPKCKFDVSCNRIDCNFTHSPIVASSSSPLVGKFDDLIYFLLVN